MSYVPSMLGPGNAEMNMASRLSWRSLQARVETARTQRVGQGLLAAHEQRPRREGKLTGGRRVLSVSSLLTPQSFPATCLPAPRRPVDMSIV